MANSTRQSLQYRLSFLYPWPQEIIAQLLTWWRSCLENAYHLVRISLGGQNQVLCSAFEMSGSQEDSLWNRDTNEDLELRMPTTRAWELVFSLSPSPQRLFKGQGRSCTVTDVRLAHNVTPASSLPKAWSEDGAPALHLVPSHLAPCLKLSQSHFAHFWQA